MAKPVLLYDGKCGFCRIWLDYWRKLTANRIDYAPSQQAGERYPQIPQEHYSQAVQLVRPDGSVASGARAVFETLGWTRFYSSALEPPYNFIASHRDLFYSLTKWTFGTSIEPSRFALTQWIFIRAVALIYAIAFASLCGQVRGLIGSQGILPVPGYLKAVAEAVGGMRFYDVPSIFWMNPSDGALVGVCYAGLAISVIVLAGYFERVGLAILFVLYLSLSAVGQDFLSFQWDSLLLEAGFLAIFLGRSRVVVWLFRWLLFRLMFLSGAVKMLSRDTTWRDLTALSYHYWTQPLPNRISWYMAQLPLGFQKISTAAVLIVELAIPFLIFAPRRVRTLGACCLLTLQLLIFSTGNYTFFNLLTMALCLFLFDDRTFERWLKPRPQPAPPTRKWPSAILAALIVSIGLARMLETFAAEPTALVKYTAPFQIVNSYGLFAMMTTSRPEIILEASMDGKTWRPYSFPFKPGALDRAPRWAAPYQPRLDWQMWFAALGTYRENPWFVNFAVKLLEGSPEVEHLLEANPFDGKAPRYLRAQLYHYSFTSAKERRETGNWWKREPAGPYLPPIGLKNQ